ncbi:MAG TPA: outer membrane lipoprotein-sorting protein [Blastocatellia bacterium]|nr:outer membrane lipoprotein-sorting protein [Blastocatellia bacterium]
MRVGKIGLVIFALFLSFSFQMGCSSTPQDNSGEQVKDDKQAQALMSETFAHFKAETLTCIAKIAKVYKNNRRFDDDLSISIKVKGPVRHLLMQVKPRPGNAGTGFLAEQRDEKITSMYRYIPETNRVTEVNLRQGSADVVIGGLSIQEFQMFQGISPFEQLSIGDEQEIDGRMCYRIDAALIDKSRYNHAQLFTSVDERLPVLVRMFNKQDQLIREISVDKLEPMAQTWVVRQLTVRDETFNYTSTFSFEDIQVDAPVADSIFTVDHLKKGWDR